MLRKPRQLFQVIFGTSLIGVGISLNYLANLGLGPWGVFHDGLSKTVGITYGRTIIITGVAVMLLWIPLKQKPGLGTLIDIFLVGLVALILLRTLRNDYAKYMRDEDDLDTTERGVGEEAGWKQVHGDVFRKPNHILLFTVFIGAGYQIIFMFGF